MKITVEKGGETYIYDADVCLLSFVNNESCEAYVYNDGVKRSDALCLVMQSISAIGEFSDVLLEGK